jgi:molybdopterin converting factor subunit 1
VFDEETMEVTVRFFASLRDITETNQCTLTVPSGANLAQMIDQLITRYPALVGHRESWHFAVNQTHVGLDVVLKAGDRVAIFPYVAGG